MFNSVSREIMTDYQLLYYQLYLEKQRQQHQETKVRP